MIKKIPLASLYPQEKFLLSRTLTKVYEDFESTALPMADFSDTVFVLPSREAGRLFRTKAAQKFKIHGGVTSLKILLPEELAVTQTEIRTTQTVMLETFFDVLKKAKGNRTFSDILPDVEYTDNTLLSYAERRIFFKACNKIFSIKSAFKNNIFSDFQKIFCIR